MLKRLKPSRLDSSYDAEMRRLITAGVVVLDLPRPRDYRDGG
ncbi:MAG: hypothetical protein ACRDJU_05520 [Actinomycetota bacterium]